MTAPFDSSTYVRTVRMLLAEKGAPCEQVPVHMLKGEPCQPEHLALHPFGRVSFQALPSYQATTPQLG